MHAVQLDTDCEGPLCLNDNAFEVCRDFIRPDGDAFFKQVSRYDDYLADIVQKPGYKAGDTLKLILPFLRAAGLTNDRLLEYSLKSILYVPGVKETYRFLHGLEIPIFEISTSYRQFALAVGQALGFDGAHIYCTELDLDRYTLREDETAQLMRFREEIAGLPEIELPAAARSLEDLGGPVQAAIRRLDEIFWELIPAMPIGALYREVNPIGGVEKARALMDSLKRTGLPGRAAMYVGDSITDVQAFEAVQAGGGLGVSFNGNRYAVASAEVIVAADTAWPVALMAAVFLLRGKEGVLALADKPLPDLTTLGLPQAWAEVLGPALAGTQFTLRLNRPEAREELTKASLEMRSKLRGAAIAALG